MSTGLDLIKLAIFSLQSETFLAFKSSFVAFKYVTFLVKESFFLSSGAILLFFLFCLWLSLVGLSETSSSASLSSWLSSSTLLALGLSLIPFISTLSSFLPVCTYLVEGFIPFSFVFLSLPKETYLLP